MAEEPLMGGPENTPGHLGLPLGLKPLPVHQLAGINEFSMNMAPHFCSRLILLSFCVPQICRNDFKLCPCTTNAPDISVMNQVSIWTSATGTRRTEELFLLKLRHSACLPACLPQRLPARCLKLDRHATDANPSSFSSP